MFLREFVLQKLLDGLKGCDVFFRGKQSNDFSPALHRMSGVQIKNPKQCWVCLAKKAILNQKQTEPDTQTPWRCEMLSKVANVDESLSAENAQLRLRIKKTESAIRALTNSASQSVPERAEGQNSYSAALISSFALKDRQARFALGFSGLQPPCPFFGGQ